MRAWAGIQLRDEADAAPSGEVVFREMFPAAFLLLPSASKANWQLFVMSAGRILSVGLCNNLGVGFNSILFKSHCTLLNCCCFVVNETKSSLCKSKIVEEQSWNLHVKSFLFIVFIAFQSLIWFRSVPQSCCALQVTFPA